MTPSLLPVLCSLLVSGSPKAEELVVHVRDAAGAPLAGIAVRAVAAAPPDMRVFGWEKTFGERARATTDERGEARFDDERLNGPLELGAELRVEPCIATVEDHGVALARGPLPKEPIEIAIPPLGRLEIELPSKPNARARLLRAYTANDEGLRANERVVCTDWARDPRGSAVLPHVGLGLRFEAALAWDGLMGEVVFTCAGPTCAGETIRVPDSSVLRLLEFEGRALDESGAPLAHATLTTQTWEGHASAFTGAGCDVTSDAEGRFRVEICVPASALNELRIGLRIACTLRATGVRVAALARVESPTRPGRRALGDVQLAPDTVELTLATYSDTVLESELRRWVASRSRAVGSPQDWVLLLAEVVRRGGARWERVVAELDAAHVRDRAEELRIGYGAEDEPASPPAAEHERHLFTALRRLQGRPDPVRLEVVGGPVFEGRFPTLPRIECRVRNLDLTEHVHVRLWDPVGQTVVLDADPIRVEDRRAAPSLRRHPPEIDARLAPGKHVSLMLSLDRRVLVNEPGTVEFRLALDEDDAGADRLDARPFALRSAPIRVKLDAAPIRIPQATYTTLRADLRSIRRDGCVKLVREPLSPQTTLVQEVREPEDRILRAGWNALPVLIDALDDPEVEPRHEEWALGLLFDLTGLHQPADIDRSLIGRTCWTEVWPASRPDGSDLELHANGFLLPAGRTRDELVSAWKALRANLDVVIE